MSILISVLYSFHTPVHVNVEASVKYVPITQQQQKPCRCILL